MAKIKVIIKNSLGCVISEETFSINADTGFSFTLLARTFPHTILCVGDTLEFVEVEE